MAIVWIRSIRRNEKCTENRIARESLGSWPVFYDSYTKSMVLKQNHKNLSPAAFDAGLVRFHFPVAICLAIQILFVGCFGESDSGNGSSPVGATTGSGSSTDADEGYIAKRRARTKRLTNLVDSEDLILDLSPRLGKFADYLQRTASGESLDLPIDFEECNSVFGLREISVSEIQSAFHSVDSKPSFVETTAWPIDQEAAAKANPWLPLVKLNAQWETIKFGVVSGDFDGEDRERFIFHTKSEGRGRSDSEDSKPLLYGFKGVQDLVFKKEAGRWALEEWRQLELKLIRSPYQLFEDVLADSLPDADALKKAQRSYMDEITLATSKSGTFELPDDKYVKWATLTADHVFPSVAVVDYDNDGFDDLFLTARWGPTQLLRNQGDGTFKDVSKGSGLEFDYLVNCALFVDLDNDGDSDAIIGRSMEPAVYLINEGGIFKDQTAELSDLDSHKQYFVSGISACDVNRDGLTDIYLSTYPPLAKQDTGFEHVFLNEFERKKYIKLKAEKDRWVDTPGTANVLLMNRGQGKLERVPYDEVLSQWRRSYQAVWADIDQDGDDDLYVCNDFAPDALIRNDTPPGATDPIFEDITDERLKQDGVGFGMGASFGDFDQDGDLDLYVSNMFSKAGNRIFNKLDSVDERLKAAAAGCFLYVNEDGKLTHSDPKRGGFAVNQVGWSYGGQWTDLDNDGKLDLYVPTGFYTAPKELDTKVDL